METQELHRGRLIDHIQLVVRDLPAAQKFYTAILDVLKIPMGGTGAGFLWADELFVSTPDSRAAQGVLTGRHHLAFQAQSRPRWTSSTKWPWPMGAGITARPESAHTIRATTLPLSSIPMATISKVFIMARQTAARPRYTSLSDHAGTRRPRSGSDGCPPARLAPTGPTLCNLVGGWRLTCRSSGPAG